MKKCTKRWRRQSIIIWSIISIFFLLILTSHVSAGTIFQKFPRSESSLAMQNYLESDPALMALMEKSIAKAHEVNPDPETNPVDNVEELYDFLNWATTALPWDVLTDLSYPSLYDHIDQSIDYIWFLLDQPLEELEECGYYYPSLEYHEPISSWCREYSDEWGSFLSTEESWNDDYYQRIRDNPSMNMQHGWYADTNVWHTFNEWFSRHLIDPSVRPIADSSVVAPADSTPQGIWDIDDAGNLVQEEDLAIKSAKFTSIAQLIGPESDYADAFAGGTLTHTFLDVNDYHRYHFPVSGTIVEVRKIPALNGVGGITKWDPEQSRYVLYDTTPGWQMIETRDCVIIDTKEYGLVAVLPIGMSQICSCNWEENVKVGAKVEKGDPMGYFLFGGSDIVMVFQSCVDVSLLCPPDGDGYAHCLMGEAYAELTPADIETGITETEETESAGNQTAITLQEYLEDTDEQWFLTGKKEYTIQAMMVSDDYSFRNELEGTDYTVTDDGHTVVMKGTVDEMWPTDIDRVMSSYTRPDGSRLEKEDFIPKDTLISITSIPTGDTHYAMFVPDTVTMTVETSSGYILHANMPGVPHGDGDFLVCGISEDGGPDLSDLWVVNGSVFPITYDTARCHSETEQESCLAA